MPGHLPSRLSPPNPRHGTVSFCALRRGLRWPPRITSQFTAPTSPRCLSAYKISPVPASVPPCNGSRRDRLTQSSPFVRGVRYGDRLLPARRPSSRLSLRMRGRRATHSFLGPARFKHTKPLLPRGLDLKGDSSRSRGLINRCRSQSNRRGAFRASGTLAISCRRSRQKARALPPRRRGHVDVSRARGSAKSSATSLERCNGSSLITSPKHRAHAVERDARGPLPRSLERPKMFFRGPIAPSFAHPPEMI